MCVIMYESKMKNLPLNHCWSYFVVMFQCMLTETQTHCIHKIFYYKYVCSTDALKRPHVEGTLNRVHM